MKPIKAKPLLYAHYFEILKRIAFTYGYNLVLHGSLDRDLDIIAIPWENEVGSYKRMISSFCKTLGTKGYVKYSNKPHGRISCHIDLNRSEWTGSDAQYYIDISILPTVKPVKE